MDTAVARILFDKASKVTERAISFAEREAPGSEERKELACVIEKGIELERLLIVYLPRD